MLVSNTEFVEKLSTLLSTSTEKHSIYVTSKRAPPKSLPSTYTPSSTTVSASHLALIFKATNGASGTSRLKFCTVVLPSDLLSFQTSYLALLRSSLSSSLNKRDKAKERKAEKVREAAKKRVTELTSEGKERLLTNNVGSKRGAGRRKRQRALKKGAEIRKELSKDASKRRKASAKPAQSDADVVMTDA